ncbi:sn-glycerol-3-phosphate ABC transporter ATP-binding protein UgpC [Labrys neptuniae]
MAQVVLNNVKKIYDNGFEAVKGVSFTVPDGGFCVLVGPSGCGKSTLLRMVAGLERISSGDIHIGERKVNEIEPMDRDIAMVFQNYALYPHMSVYDNMAYGLRNRRTAESDIAGRVKEAARILELSDDMLKRKPRQLSGGQRQRVAMGRAIVRQPAAFLFDEPLSNLDAKLRVQMRGEIKQLQQRLGTTSIYVTHDQLEAMTLADVLVVLNGGAIEQIGAPLEIYRKPASTFVAAFIGSPAMNVLKGRGEGGTLGIGEARLALSHPVSGEVLVGLRAEDLQPLSGPAPGSLPVKLRYVEELGAHRLMHGEIGGQPLVVSLGMEHAIGDEMWFGVDPGAIHLFDAVTRSRLPG